MMLVPSQFKHNSDSLHHCYQAGVTFDTAHNIITYTSV